MSTKKVRVMLSTEKDGQGKRLAGAKEANLSIKKNSIDISSFDSNGWEEFTSGMSGYDVSVSGIVVSDKEAYDLLKGDVMNKTNGLYITMIDEATNEVFEGKVLVEDFGKDAAFEDARQYSATLKGTGELTEDVYVPTP